MKTSLLAFAATIAFTQTAPASAQHMLAQANSFGPKSISSIASQNGVRNLGSAVLSNVVGGLATLWPF